VELWLLSFTCSEWLLRVRVVCVCVSVARVGVWYMEFGVCGC
jgi:hypothetical protein